MSGEQPKILDQEVLELLRDAIGASTDHIIELYLQDVPQDLQKMQQALTSGDFATVRRLAHSLKASSANLGAMQTSALAAELEHSISEAGNDAAILKEEINKLLISFDQTRTMFNNLQK